MLVSLAGAMSTARLGRSLADLGQDLGGQGQTLADVAGVQPLGFMLNDV